MKIDTMKKTKKAVDALLQDDTVLHYMETNSLPVTHANAIKVNLDMQQRAFNALSKSTATAEVYSDAEKKFNDAIRLHNNWQMYCKLNALIGLDYNAAFVSYMDNNTVNGLARRELGVNGKWLVNYDKTAEVSFSDLLSLTRTSEYATLLDLCAIVIDNMARFNANNSDSVITKRALHDDYNRLRTRLGWDNVEKLSDITKQLDYLVRKYIAPPKSKIKMREGDTIWLRDSFISTRMANDHQYETVNDEDAINYVAFAVSRVIASKGYAFAAARAEEKGLYADQTKSETKPEGDSASTAQATGSAEAAAETTAA